MRAIPGAAGAARWLDRTLIDALARELDRSQAEVERVLLEELAVLAADARIETFIAVLATRQARDRLRTGRPAAH